MSLPSQIKDRHVFKMSHLWQISAAAKPIAIALQHPMPCKTKPKTLGVELLTTFKWSINLYKWPKIIGQLSTGALRPGGNHRVLVEELMPMGRAIESMGNFSIRIRLPRFFWYK